MLQRRWDEFRNDRSDRRPVAYMGHPGSVGADVRHAHVVFMAPDEFTLMAGARVAYSLPSNMRLTSGIAPIRDISAPGRALAMADGGPVALGVDGSACKGWCNFRAKVREAMLLARGTWCVAHPVPTRNLTPPPSHRSCVLVPRLMTARAQGNSRGPVGRIFVDVRAF